jgi:hypothetical protein
MTIPRTCKFTKSDGTPCRALASGRARYCSAHQRQAARDHRRNLALHPGRTIRLSRLDTRSSIQRSVSRLLHLLFSGTLPLDRAGRAACRIQVAVTALNRAGVPHLQDLLSLPHPPTIEETPAIRRPSQPAVHNRSHRLSSQGPPVYQNQPAATNNG